MKLKIYTDGACSGNPGKGGWAAIILDDSNESSISGSESNTTNNRMELMAPIMALKKIKTKVIDPIKSFFILFFAIVSLTHLFLDPLNQP